MWRQLLCVVFCSATCFGTPDKSPFALHPWVTFGGYAASYSSSRGESPFHDLLNLAPRDVGGVNYAAGGVRLSSNGLFGSFALQYGDGPKASWNSDMRWLQEAWLGYHFNNDVHIQLGAFASHIGVESMSGFENYSGIISVPGFFDPNYFAGARLLLNVSDDLVVNLDAMTSFNGYILDGDIPAPILGLTYEPDSTVQLSINSMISDEPLIDGVQVQWYTNASAIIHLGSTHLVSELNYGYEFATQERAKGLMMISGFVGAYHDIAESIQTGLRIEAYHDPESILADDRFAHPVPFNTLSVAGITATVSYKPNSWSLLRFDVRQLEALNQRSYVDLQPDVQSRTEMVLSADILLGSIGQ